MSHNIPKIQYGPLNTEVVFAYPPVTKNGNNPEELDSVDHTTFSISGKRQTSVDYVQALRTVVFDQVSEAVLTQLQTFFTAWAYLGQSFRYFDDQNSPTYVTYELQSLKWKPTRTAAVGANAYVYQVPLTFRRVVGSPSTDAMIFTIPNNQVAPYSVPGLTLDNTQGQTYTMDLEIVRKTDSSEHVWRGIVRAEYKLSTSVWDITPVGNGDGDAHGLTFSMSGNQVQFTSDNQAGANYVGTGKVRSFTAS